MMDNGSGSHHRYNNHRFFRMVGSVGLLFGMGVITCFALYRVAYPFQFMPQSAAHGLVHDCTRSSFSASSDKKLKGILEKAATRDKTVIITTLNAAWAAPNSIFDLFLESFRIGNETRRFLNHLVVIAMDQKTYERCLALHTHCYLLRINGMDFSADALYMTTNYLEMNWGRIDFLRTVLELGYNFVFTDADVMWFRDPFPHFYPDADFQIACDIFHGPSSVNNEPNGGFKYVKSNNHTIKLYKFWFASRETYPDDNEQDVLNMIRLYPSFNKKIGVKMRFLDTAYYGGFCQPSKDLNRVCTMHANCCIGVDRKAHDLKIMLEDWRIFLSLPTHHVRASTSTSTSTSWRVPQFCWTRSKRSSN